MTAKWEERPFAEVADYSVGKTPARASAAFWDQTSDLQPWVTISDMPAYGTISSTKESISRDAFDRVFGGHAVPAGTLIMSFKLTIGRVATLGIPAVHNEAIISIVPKPGIDQRFLGYYLSQVDYTQFQDRQIRGNTLNRSKIDRIPVPVLPETEQKAIADILDAVRGLIEAEEETLAATRRLVRAVGHRIFSGIADSSGSPVRVHRRRRAEEAGDTSDEAVWRELVEIHPLRQDLVVGAIADAAKQVTILAHDRLGPLAGGMGGLGLPGL